MIVKYGGGIHYQNISKTLEKTTLKYTQDESKLKNISITFFVRSSLDTDIFMSHGCADKNYREIENGKYLHKFKLILVPGPWLKKKLITYGIHESKIACVGWPKLDPLFLQLKKWKPNNNYKTVLWVPTHNWGIYKVHKTSISSYPRLYRYMNYLNKLTGIKIIISTHPKNRKEKIPTLDKLVACDYVIADAGSTVYEAWALGKPVIFPDWIVKNKILNNIPGSAEEYIYTNNIGYHANNINELVSLLKSDLIIEKDVKDFMEDYMPSKFNGRSGKAVYRAINKFFIIESMKPSNNSVNLYNTEYFNSNKNINRIFNIYTFICIIFLIIFLFLKLRGRYF